jgi:hypothetical protein
MLSPPSLWTSSLAIDFTRFRFVIGPYSMLVSNMVSWAGMEAVRKITVEVPPDLLERAQRATGTGVTQTVRTGLQLVAASETYSRLRQLRGKVRFSRTAAELKDDR